MVTVENIANVLAAVGADELDYTISVTGDLIGAFSGTDWALGGGETHNITLDTTTAGAKSGQIIVETTSPGSPVTMIPFDINFTVGGGLPGDFNADGTVDGFDFLEWQLDPNVGNLADWEANYGLPTLSAAGAQVPEPSALVLLTIGILAGSSRYVAGRCTSKGRA